MACNEAFAALCGRRRDTLGRDWGDLGVGPLEGVTGALVAAIEAEGPTDAVLRGGRRVRFSALTADAQGVSLIATEVTAPDDLARALEAAEARYERLSRAGFDGIIVSVDGRVIEANHVVAELVGAPREQVIGADAFQFVAPSDRDRVRRAIESRSDTPYEVTLVRSDGTKFPAELLGRSILLDGAWARVTGVRDITDRKAALQATHKVREAHHALLDLLPIGYIEIDTGGRLEEANAAALAMLGFARLEDARAADLFSLLDASERPMVRERLAMRISEARPARTELTVHLGGRLRHIEVYSRPLVQEGGVAGLRLVLVDIAERRRAEDERRRLQDQLRHAQRLESLVLLAGSIAHDFNNLLVSILGNVDLALQIVDRNDAMVLKALQRTRTAALQVSELTMQMLVYAGRGPTHRGPVDVNALVRDLHTPLRAMLERTRLVTQEAEDLPPVLADPAQLRQVLLNLVKNGIEAIGKRKGEITVSTGLVELDTDARQELSVETDLPDGRYVTIEVTDDGQGMTEAELARIFEPFYTTREGGRGLGLPVVLGVVRAHDGAVVALSEPGVGSTFTILLPVIEGSVPIPREAQQPAVARATTPARVLVVDDDAAVAAVTQELLDLLGHSVVTARDGQEAVDRFTSAPGEFDLVILDLTMPGLSSKDTLDALRALRPDIPVVACTGFDEGDVWGKLGRTRLQGYLGKPFTLSDLERVVASALETAPGAGLSGPGV